LSWHQNYWLTRLLWPLVVSLYLEIVCQTITPVRLSLSSGIGLDHASWQYLWTTISRTIVFIAKSSFKVMKWLDVSSSESVSRKISILHYMPFRILRESMQYLAAAIPSTHRRQVAKGSSVLERNPHQKPHT
jgi:hypothetical protein